MSKKLSIYYLVLLAIVGAKLCTTLFQSSLVVYHSQQLHSLHAKRQELTQKQLALKSELSKKESLVSLADSATLGSFEPLGAPIVIGSTMTVANAL